MYLKMHLVGRRSFVGNSRGCWKLKVIKAANIFSVPVIFFIRASDFHCSEDRPPRKVSLPISMWPWVIFYDHNNHSRFLKRDFTEAASNCSKRSSFCSLLDKIMEISSAEMPVMSWLVEMEHLSTGVKRTLLSIQKLLGTIESSLSSLTPCSISHTPLSEAQS